MHENDKISVDMWVNKMNSGPDSPVLYFKQQNTPTSENGIMFDDFILVIETKPQLELLTQLGGDKICIDATHGTCGKNDFLLTSLVVVDEFACGFPVAQCISTRVNTPVMVVFFDSLKKKIGDIQANVFMSDGAQEFFNGWCEVMSPPSHKLLCTWHVDKNWRENIQEKIKSRELQCYVYKIFRVILECTNKEQLEDILNAFVNESLEDQRLVDFVNYAKRHWFGKLEEWVYLYRIGLGINTNMYLESLHKVLKHCYLEGKKNKRVDNLIAILLRMVRNKICDRHAKLVRGTSAAHRQRSINKSHKHANTIKQIRALGQTKWEVGSESTPEDFYEISKISNPSCGGLCQVKCSVCRFCAHEFACTCTDYIIKFNMCKHIHAVAQTLATSKPYETIPTPSVIDPCLLEHVEQLNDIITKRSTQDDIIHSVNRLVGLSSVCGEVVSEEDQQKALKLLESAAELLRGPAANRKHKIIDNEPHNKPVEKQRRFTSVKKRNEPRTTSMSKPSTREKRNIIHSLKNPQEQVEDIRSTSDHIY